MKNSAQTKQECTEAETAARRAQASSEEAQREAREAEAEAVTASEKEALAQLVCDKCQKGHFREMAKYKQEHTKACDDALLKREYANAKAYLASVSAEEAAALTAKATGLRETLQRQIEEGQAAEGGVKEAAEFLKGSSRVNRLCFDRGEVYSGAFFRQWVTSHQDGVLPVDWELFSQLLQSPRLGAAQAIHQKLKEVVRDDDPFHIALQSAARRGTIRHLQGNREQNKAAMARLRREKVVSPCHERGQARVPL